MILIEKEKETWDLEHLNKFVLFTRGPFGEEVKNVSRKNGLSLPWWEGTLLAEKSLLDHSMPDQMTSLPNLVVI